MKKLFVKGGSLVLISAMLILAFTACPTEPSSEKSNKAELTSIFAVLTAGDEYAGDPGDAIPKAVWNGLTSKSGLDSASISSLDFEGNAEGDVTFTPTASKKAKVAYAVAKADAIPTTFVDVSNPASGVVTDDTVYIRVTSESGKTVNYYAFEVKNRGAAPSGSTSTSGFKVGDGQPVTPVNNNTKPTLAEVTPIAYTMPWANTTGNVTLQLNRAVTTTGSQAISWAVVRGSSTDKPAETDFTAFDAPASGNTLTATVSTTGLADGDTIYIKVIAADTITTAYYGYTMSAGNVAELESITIGGEAGTSLGTPADTLATVTAAVLDLQDVSAGPAVTMVAVGKDGGVVSFAVTTKNAAGTAPVPNNFTVATDSSTISLTTGSVLWIEVKSANESKTVYYRFDILLKSTTDVWYGQPTIYLNTTTPGAAPQMDPLWDSIPWNFDVSRVNLNEMNPVFKFLNTVDGAYADTGYGHTEGKAKAFWDDYGMYVYAEMAFHDYYASANDQAAGTVTPRTTVLSPTSVTDSNIHNYDSMEIFTNERLQQYTSGNYGIQYRVAPSSDATAAQGGAGTYSRISGNEGTGAPTGAAGPLNVLRNSNRYYSWIRKDGAKEIGYSVMAYIPWVFKSDANATQVYDATTGKVKTTGDQDGPTVGANFQLNTVTAGGSRDAILTWNGVTGQSYQRVENYGKAKLILNLTARPGVTRGAKDPKKVSFDTAGGVPDTIAAINVTPGGTAGAMWPNNPTKAGYSFGGWFVGATEYTSTTVINTDVTVVAKWVDVSLASATLQGATIELATPAASWAAAAAKQITLDIAMPASLAVTAIATDTANATVEYGISNANATEPTWVSDGSALTTVDPTFIGVKVSNVPAVSFYKWRVAVTGGPSSNANIRAVSGTGPNTKYGLYIAGMPGVSNGTPAGSIATLDTSSSTVNMGGTYTTADPANNSSIVVIVEDPGVTSVRVGTNNAANETTAVVGWDTLTKNDTNGTDETTGKRWVGTLTATRPTASVARRVYVEITAADGTVQYYRYVQYVSTTNTPPPRAELTTLSIGGVPVIVSGAAVAPSTKGTFAGWWNKTVAPEFAPGEVTLDAGGTVSVNAVFNNPGESATTTSISFAKIAGGGWPLMEDSVLTWTAAGNGVSVTSDITGVANGDYIIIRLNPSTNANYVGYISHYIIKVNCPVVEGDYLVTFDKNTYGTCTNANPATIGVTSFGASVTLPTPPEMGPGWDAGVTFTGWNTKADGTGTPFTAATGVTESITVYAQWAFTPGIIEEIGETLVHWAPVTATNKDDSSGGDLQGLWNVNNTLNADGSVSIKQEGSANYQGGCVRYLWPHTGLPGGVNIDDYDFCVLDYVHATAGGGTAAMGVLFKQGLTATDYTSSPTSGNGAATGTLSTAAAGASLPRFALKVSGYDQGGIALQRSTAGGGTVKFVKATFSKGVRRTITFDTNYGGGEAIAPITAVVGVPILNLPTPAARAGWKFSGWTAGSTAYTNASTMPAGDGALALVAGWLQDITLAPIVVDFTGKTFRGLSSGSAVALDDGTGYTYSCTGYNSAVVFKITLPANAVLANYDKISFTLNGVSGDTTYKSCTVIGAITATTNADNVTTYTGSPQNVQAAFPVNLVFTIDKSKVLTNTTLTGEIELGFYVNTNTASYTLTNFRIYQD